MLTHRCRCVSIEPRQSPPPWTYSTNGAAAVPGASSPFGGNAAGVDRFECRSVGKRHGADERRHADPHLLDGERPPYRSRREPSEMIVSSCSGSCGASSVMPSGGHACNPASRCRRRTGGGPTLVDIREAAERRSTDDPGTRHIPMAELESVDDRHATSGSSTTAPSAAARPRASEFLRAKGYTNVAPWPAASLAWTRTGPR